MERSLPLLQSRTHKEKRVRMVNIAIGAGLTHVVFTMNEAVQRTIEKEERDNSRQQKISCTYGL